MIVSISHPNPQDLANFLRHLVNQKGARFVAFKGYENKQGEISDITVNIGVSYGNAKDRDTEKLRNAENFAHLNFEGVSGLAEQARIALLEASIKPDAARSQGQKDAYETIIPNVLKVHKETGTLFVFGFVHSKTVIKEGVYQTVNSSALTIAKNIFRKALDAPKYRQYNIEKIEGVRINGETIELL